MAPTRPKTQKSIATPTRSPIKKMNKGISAAQKQALIDNLQLEITERARKLRAQYNLQAQGLRSRIEIRINRIPTALRKVKMGDLLLKHSDAPKQAAAGPSRATRADLSHKSIIQHTNIRASPSPQRGMKRLSDEITADKENEDIENPKKRPRDQPPMPPARTTSKLAASQVLSPRSANSRTLPQSPIRSIVPQKSFLARPVSPLKPIVPSHGKAADIVASMVEKARRGAAATRKITAVKEPASTATGAGRGRRTPAPAATRPAIGKGRASTTSESSDASSSTVVKKPVAAPAKKAPVKKTVMSTLKGMGSQRKIPATTKTATATAPAGGRVLRKRN